MNKFSNKILLTLSAVVLSSSVAALPTNKKPVANEGKMDKAVEAIDSAKSGLDSVKGSREGSTVSGAETEKADDSSTTTNSDANDSTQGTKSNLYVNSKTAFDISSTDDATRVDYIEYKINASEYQKYTGPIYLPQEGVTSIAYRAVDRAGNKEAAKVLVVTVDNTPPAVTIKPVEQLYVVEDTKLGSQNTTYTVLAEDKSSGVNKIMYSIDSEPKQEYKGQPFKIEKSGPHVIKATAVDNAGNESDEVTYTVNVDNAAPTVKIIESMPLLVVDSKSYAKRGTTFSIKAQDPESGVSKILVKIDGSGDFTSYADPIEFSSAGEHVIEAKAIDNVGNESQVTSLKVLVDVVPPSTIIKAVTK